MTECTDVVVVGARCAGSALAVGLARAGVRVRLVDKARFPSDTPSTHIIQPRGRVELDRLGVLDAARAAGAADITGVTLQYGDARADADYAVGGLSTGAVPGLSLRRRTLDALLLEAAEEAGAQIRTSTAVEGLLTDADGRVRGVRTAQGDCRARVVVGADGRASSVADLVGARSYATYRAPRLACWGYFAGAAAHDGRLRIGRIGSTALIATPTDDDLLLVGAVPQATDREHFLADRPQRYAEQVRRWPELHALIADATQVGPLHTVPDWTAYFRRSAGPGWVLTGDAGHFKDPSAAQGITDALRQSADLATALLGGLDDGGDPDAAAHAWWRRRDRDEWDMHWFARDMGVAGPTTPVLTELVRDLGMRDPMLLARVLNRDVPSTAALTPRRVVRAAVRAVSRRPAALPGVLAEGGRAARSRLASAATRVATRSVA